MTAALLGAWNKPIALPIKMSEKIILYSKFWKVFWALIEWTRIKSETTIEKPINKIADIEKDLKLPNTPENANEIGLAGELYVLNYKKKILKDNNKIDLAEKVRHISIEIGDGAGYDILSYEFNGDTKFIEVKTTQSNTKQFIITLNEKSKMFGETNYYLYHLTNFNMDTKKGNIKMIKKGELIKEEVLEYVISPKKLELF